MIFDFLTISALICLIYGQKPVEKRTKFLLRLKCPSNLDDRKILDPLCETLSNAKSLNVKKLQSSTESQSISTSASELTTENLEDSSTSDNIHESTPINTDFESSVYTEAAGTFSASDHFTLSPEVDILNNATPSLNSEVKPNSTDLPDDEQQSVEDEIEKTCKSLNALLHVTFVNCSCCFLYS